jgi:D-psicose/D-tagatose/L-ribulose 3-epimerase
MKFGVSSYVWVSPFSDDTLSQLEKAKGIGFDIYEIGVEDPSSFNPVNVKANADKIGIQVTICGAFGEQRDISSEKKEYREEGLRYIRTLIDYAKIVGSPYVAGPMYAATGKARLATAEEKARQRSYAVENLRLLCDYAAKSGVCLALEPLNRFETDFLNTVDQGLDLIGEVGKENLGFLLDTFHMNIEEKSIGQAIRKAGNRIFDFHACANDRGTPGEDHFDWAAIATALKEVGYDGAVVIESFTTDIKEIAKAVSLWRPLAKSQDELATKGIAFLKEALK